MTTIRRLSFLLAGSFLLTASSCKQADKQPDPQITRLQEDVQRLSQENKTLLDEIQGMRQQLSEQIASQTQSSAQTKPATGEMTVDRMKGEIEPLLQDILKKMKAANDTPRKGNQFGMRTEYDMKRAVYGLVRNDDPRTPFFAKVVVRYERFLESENESKSYGFGTTNFLFAYRNNHWVLETYQ